MIPLIGGLAILFIISILIFTAVCLVMLFLRRGSARGQKRSSDHNNTISRQSADGEIMNSGGGAAAGEMSRIGISGIGLGSSVGTTVCEITATGIVTESGCGLNALEPTTITVSANNGLIFLSSSTLAGTTTGSSIAPDLG